MATGWECRPVLVELDEPRRLVREHLQRALAGDGRVSVRTALGPGSEEPAAVVVRGPGALGRRAAADVPSVSLEDHDLTDPETAVSALLAAVAAVGPRSTDGPTAWRPAPSTAPRVLSPYERTVIEGLGRGLTAATVASELAVSPKSVENAKRRAYDKLGARSQAEAVYLVSAAR